MDNLKQKTLTGLFWNMVERVGLRIVQFLPTILLARLLAPEEFGLVGMLAIFIALAQTFLDSGFGVALIQKQDASYTDECSIFYFNILLGGVVIVALYLAAPLIAAFYNQPLLVPLTRWLSLTILIESFSLIQVTLLTRSLDFKTQIKANLFAALCAGVIGVAAAYYGLGVWSLVIQTLANRLLFTITLWRLSNWRPGRRFSLASSLQGMFGFGSRMLASSLLSVFFDNFYQMFIGRVFSAGPLGYYTRAVSLRGVVIDATSNSLGRVTYPALASIQNDVERLKRGYRKTAVLSTFIHFPLMIGLIVTAQPLITLLFSARWVESVLFFQLMCVAGLPYPLSVINLDILKVKGRSDLFLRLEIIKRSLIVVNALSTYRWGIGAMLVGHIMVSMISYALNSFYSERLMAYPMKQQILDVLPWFVLSCLMGVGMVLVGRALGSSGDFWRLIIQTATGFSLYLIPNLIWKSEPMVEMFGLVTQWTARLPGEVPQHGA